MSNNLSKFFYEVFTERFNCVVKLVGCKFAGLRAVVFEIFCTFIYKNISADLYSVLGQAATINGAARISSLSLSCFLAGTEVYRL